MLQVHISTGLLAILAGFIALFAPKGERLHRLGGTVFVAAMVTMLATGAFMAFFVTHERANGIGALFTIYLVLSSLLTIKHPVEQVRGPTAALAAFAAVLGAGGLLGLPSANSLPFTGIAFACAASDLRLLRRGSIAGTPRLVRHLWRMTFALWVATASFFLGQAKVLPAAMQNFALLSIPVVTVLAMLVYWLLRLRRGRSRTFQVPQGRFP